jgi:hypothetical protein
MGKFIEQKEKRFARMINDKSNFLIEKFCSGFINDRRKVDRIKRQYRELLKHSSSDLLLNLSWAHDGEDCEKILGIDGSIPYRAEEVSKLGGVSKQAVAYLIVKKQFSNYEFLRLDS